jgi:glycosyltransferase involved in cell wall biosynthesis
VSAEIRKPHSIFLIDPKNIVLSGGIDTLNRHQLYDDRVKHIESNSRVYQFKVLCTQDENFKEFYGKYKYLVSIPKRNKGKNLNFVIASLKIIKENQSDSILLVSGDPWKAAIYCIILKFLTKQKIRIQIQVHGDIGEKLWRNKSLRNHLKYYVSFYTLKKADSIRCVSEPQLIKIKEIFKIDKAKLFCSGTVYELPSKEMRKNKGSRIPTIGFIGRIEPDRGIWQFVEIVKKLNSLGITIDIKIAGTGKSQPQFLTALKKINSGEVDYLGQLSQKDIHFFWNSINLSIFTAPTESFGRGMRESLANNVPLWAVDSSGFQDLKTKFKTDAIMQISTSESREILEKKLNTSLNLRIDYDYREYFTKEQKMDLERLINSWVQN